MKEISITGINAITYPHLEIWNWLVAIYLFLGGLVAGLMVFGAISQLRKSSQPNDSPEKMVSVYLAPILSPILLSIGMFFLFLDLTRKFNTFWFYLSFNPTSPMSWGAWGLILILPLSTLWAIASAPPSYLEKIKMPWIINLYKRLLPHRKKLAMINFGLGIFLGIYTGILLSSFVARPLWNTALLPIFFLNSGLSTGAATLVLLTKDPQEKLFLTKADITLIASEIIVILLFIYGHLTSSAPHQAAIAPFFTTGYYLPFWIATFIIGIALPLALVLDIVEVTGFAKFRIHLSAWLVLLSGLVIRIAIIYAGQLSTLNDIVKS